MTAPPYLWLIAGADGVGKTTYAFKTVPALTGSVHFVNLDEIARGLAPLQPSSARLRAARVATQMVEDLIGALSSFSIETTLSGQTHRGLIRRARHYGYQVHLVYFWVSDVAICKRRVRQRVAQGGHDVPTADIERRYERSIKNFVPYTALVNEWMLFDANGMEPKLMASGADGVCHDVVNPNFLPQNLMP